MSVLELLGTSVVSGVVVSGAVEPVRVFGVVWHCSSSQ